MAISEATLSQKTNTYMFDHPTKLEPSPRWVRVMFGGEFVADSKRPLLLIQYGPGKSPTYYFPREDVRMDLLEPAPQEDETDGTVYWSVKAGGKAAAKAAWSHLNPPPELGELKGYIGFKWHKMDAWYEEDEEIFVHPRDPYKRVDVVRSSRHVQVVVAGEVVADTQRPYLLFETGLPTRYYIPREDVRMDLLKPSKGTTRCPYKGVASYWSLRLGDQFFKNIVWSYLDPIPECSKIKGLMSFYNEKVDIYVDGELQPRPETPWS